MDSLNVLFLISGRQLDKTDSSAINRRRTIFKWFSNSNLYNEGMVFRSNVLANQCHGRYGRSMEFIQTLHNRKFED